MKNLNKRQLALFADEIDKYGKQSENSAQEFSKFFLAGRVRELDDFRKTQRRYRWHKQLKARGIMVDGSARTIDVSQYNSFQDIPVPARWYVGQLIRRGYNAEFKLKL